jgi:hypothetical protein
MDRDNTSARKTAIHYNVGGARRVNVGGARRVNVGGARRVTLRDWQGRKEDQFDSV